MRILIYIILVLNVINVYSENGYKEKIYVSALGDTLRYRFLEPESKGKNGKYPLVIFLHGAGERGTDNISQLKHGGQMFLNPVNMERYPTFVLFPQCPSEQYWGYGSRPSSFVPEEMPIMKEEPFITKQLKELIDSYLKDDRIDKSRVYLIGISMGAMGVYDLVARYPDIFAAVVPVCGIVNPLRLKNVKKTRFRIFHGDADDVVPVEGSRAAYRFLKQNGGSADYIEFAGVKHDSWNNAFNLQDFMSWIFKQKR